ncbi:hypothetical protein, partial [Bacillus thuringiensis]|uniref:hypothetical protein n=1 Tax=Bacillus thuringiensis TaxID=1428 RepID=UPI002AB595BB
MFVYIFHSHRSLNNIFPLWNPLSVQDLRFVDETTLGSVAKFLNREKVGMIADGFYALVSKCFNSLYVEKTKFDCCK